MTEITHSDESRVFHLGPKDSVLIIREDGTEEVRTPRIQNQSEFVPMSAVTILKAVMALHDPQTLAFITHRIESKRRQS